MLLMYLYSFDGIRSDHFLFLIKDPFVINTGDTGLIKERINRAAAVISKVGRMEATVDEDDEIDEDEVFPFPFFFFFSFSDFLINPF